MASFFGKIVAKRIMGESVQNKFGREDPYFEMVPASRLDGRPSRKLKRQRKALPPGISEHDGQVLTKVKRRAYRLDMSLCNFMGIRFGWSSVIGIIPAIGDVVDMLMAVMVMKTCAQVEGGLPNSVRMKMMFNIALDFAIGLVPFVGDVADAVFRANTRNAVVLEDYLREKGRKQLRRSGQPIPAVDPSSSDVFDRDENPPAYAEDIPDGHHSELSQPQNRTQQPVAPRVKESSGWFGRNKSRPADPEMGRSDQVRTGR